MTEQAVDYGPLAPLIGTWFGDKGMDVAPAPDGTEESPYSETLTFEAAGDLLNAEEQRIAVVRYHQCVSRKSNGEVFHDQVGYWMWEAAEGVVMQSLAIPRGLCVLAGGRSSGDPAGGGPVEFEVAARLGDPDWGIVQSPFLRQDASTLAFDHRLTVEGARLSYKETTLLSIYGRKFEHTDENELVRG